MSAQENSDVRRSEENNPKNQQKGGEQRPRKSEYGDHNSDGQEDDPGWDHPETDPTGQPGYTPEKDLNLDPS